MTDRLPQESSASQKQIVNLNYLDREAQLYKQSKNELVEYSKQVQQAVEQNTKQEVEEVEAAIKRLNEKVEKIMETNYVKERQQKIESAQQQMMKSMRDAVPKSDLMNSDHLDTYQAMADQQMAVNLSQQGGIGLARMLVEQMQTRGYLEETSPDGLDGTSLKESRRVASDFGTSKHDVTGGNDG